MSLAVLANHMASKGRNGDSMLVHMTPEEVHGLHALALAHGGKLTINPETGLPEANFLKKMLPTILGAAFSYFTGLPPEVVGLTVGGVEAARTGDLGKGIAAGLGAYGGANLTSAFTSAGTEAIGAQALSEAGKTGVLERAALMGGEQGLSTVALTEPAAREAITREAIAKASPFDKFSTGLSGLAEKEGRDAFMKEIGGFKGLARSGLGIAAPLMAGEAVKANMPQTVTKFAVRDFDPYGGTYTTRPTMYGAGGGLMGLAAGGAIEDDFAQRSEPVVRMAVGGQTPTGVLTPEQFKQHIYQGGADDVLATQRGVEYARSANLTPQQTLDVWNQGLGTNFGMADYERVMKQFPAVTPPSRIEPGTTGRDVTYGGDTVIPEYIAPQPQVTLGEAFKPTPQTVEQVRSEYEEGGGSTKMPTITDIKPGERTYTQNAVADMLTGFLQKNPNAAYGEVLTFARMNGIPEMQAKAAYNEFRFSGLTGGSKQTYDYLMGRGAAPIKPYSPTGELMRPYAESVLGVPENRKTKRLIFDPETRTYKPNPDYVPRKSAVETAPIRDVTGSIPSMSSNTEAYFRANPDVRSAWQAGTTGMDADAYAAFHWNTFGKKEGRSGWTEGTGGGSGSGGGGTDTVIPAARGGLMDIAAAAAARGGNVERYNLGGYSDGGRLLRGPGDGVSDSIPATIGGKRPARLADGEFVVPARIVSEIGNGSTEAGARKLYAMMDRVQRARSKTVGKGKVAKNTRAEKYLPA